MTLSMSAEKSKNQSGLLVNAKPSRQKSAKKLYCGTCPACKTLKTISFPFSSTKNTADIIKRAGLAGAANRTCVAGFLQENYGNRFTQRTMESLNKPGLADNKKETKIKRSPTARNINEEIKEPIRQEGSGRSLDFSTRSFMESKMGHSFNKVKIHTDSYATKSARDLNAHAYTKGNDIFFAAGKYKPETIEGKKLLAHELTHVAQQNKNASNSFLNRYQDYNVSSPGDAQERYAEQVAASVSRGNFVPVKAPTVQSNVKTIHRKSDDESKSGIILEKIAEYAEDFPGFTLLTFLLGKNPITGEAVKRNAKLLLEGLLGIIPGGDALFKKLNESKAIDEAFAWLSDQIKAMNITWESIKELFKKAWDSFSWYDLIWDFSGVVKRIKNIFAPTLNKIKNFAIALGRKIYEFVFKGALKMIGAPVKKFMGILKKAGDTISLIISDPIQFLKHLLSALKKGFKQFASNIWEHLKTGLKGWLFGTLAKAGIQVPEKLDAASIFGLAMQVLGITKEFLRKKAARAIGEKNVVLIEKVWSFISTLISSGISGLWDMAKEYLGNLKDMVIGAIQDWVVTKIVQKAVVKLASMFNPVGAVITAIQTIYNTIMFFIERIKQIMALVESIVESIASIAKGVIGKAADWIEKTMARTLPVIISFLARLIGLGGISEKIKGIILKLQEKVSMAIDKVIDKVVKKVKGLLGKILPGKEKDKDKDKDKDSKEAEALLIGREQTQMPIKCKKESHTLWYEIDKKGKSRLMIASSDQKAVKFLENLINRIGKKKSKSKKIKEVKAETKNLKKDAEKFEDEAEGIGKISGRVTTAKQEIKESSKLNKGQAEIANALKSLIDEIATLNIYPKKNIKYGKIDKVNGLEIGGTSVTAKNISFPEIRGEGSEPGIKWPLWDKLDHSEYVRGHLLNHHLGGPGNKIENLTPITGSANTKMSNDIEEKAKEAVLVDDNIIDYKVKVKNTVDESMKTKIKITTKINVTAKPAKGYEKKQSFNKSEKADVESVMEFSLKRKRNKDKVTPSAKRRKN